MELGVTQETCGGKKHAFLFLAFHHSKVLVEVEAEGEVSLVDT